jgi:hypothetical protein
MSHADSDLTRLLGDMVDLLSERIAERVVARLEPQPEHDAWLDVASAAQYIGVHPDTLRKRAKAGLVPFEQEAPGHRIYFLRSELAAWRGAGGAAAEVARLADRPAMKARRAA